MYPSGSGSFSGCPGVVRKGADISLEGLNEWRIQEIGYDGVEKYIRLVFMCFRPPSFSDNVGKLARKVDWKKLIGSDAVYDNPNSVINETDDEKDVKIIRILHDFHHLQSVEVRPVVVEERVVPEAGPWHNVAKFLHESLQQLNVLLDNLAIMRATDYMKPLTILDPIHAESGPMLAESTAASKATQWALLEAMSVLELAQRLRNVEVEDEVHQQKSQFFSELTKMREYWRVRKTGDHIYGDLGYHIFGSKYNPRELFDISRVSIPPGTSFDSNTSVLQVTVPRDLTRRSTLSVSIVKDDHMNRDLFASLDDYQFEYMKVASSKIESIRWTNALTWAQETLICKDIFNTLCSDAVQMRNRLSTIRDGVLLVSLYNDYLLRVELKYHPFKEGDLPEEGCPYLNRALREMMVAQECTRWMRPQIANYYIRVTSTSVCLVSKEGHSMDCYRDPHQLMYALKYMACTFSVSSISSLGKAMWFYQLLHANMNATDEYGRPAPTLYMLNPDATM
ncbi:unnamed protein product [Angiostrongylus costaricensis]|uniref:Mediator complex subunit 17 n=1 Tax=Angiostrongylus costaricensis TaxID=334426 RepID=A0A158PI00_ANGCS|nr:unnamed protein product [Angiostrongylus costaricensis]